MLVVREGLVHASTVRQLILELFERRFEVIDRFVQAFVNVIFFRAEHSIPDAFD